MKNAAIRAVRTFVQAFIGIFALVATPWATNIINAIVSGEPYTLDFSVLQSAAIAGAFAAFISALSWAQNALEDTTHTTVIPK